MCPCNVAYHLPNAPLVKSRLKLLQAITLLILV